MFCQLAKIIFIGLKASEIENGVNYMISKISNQPVNVAFAAKKLTPEEKAERKYYAEIEKQKRELEEFANDEKTPKVLSKPARALIILSSGVLSFGIMKVSLGKSIDVVNQLARKVTTSRPVLKARIALRHAYRNGMKAIKNSDLLKKPFVQEVKNFFTTKYNKIMKNKYVTQFTNMISDFMKNPNVVKVKEALSAFATKTKTHAKDITVNTLAGASAVTGAMTGAGLTNRDPMAVLVGESK